MKCEELRYPVGIQSFVEMREGGYVYVDKTAFVHKLIRGGKYYFLSRPRRFGKSLLLSTIEAYFRGRRDLFSGLALDSLADSWEAHPILHLDLNVGVYDSPASLDAVLDYALSKWEDEFGIVHRDLPPSLRFSSVIERAHRLTGKKAVILIDEYDKPMLNAIDDEPLADSFRSSLKALYGNLKTMDSHIEFAMLTGVARFSKVSIFSDLNNLRDISFEPKFSAICGITNEELDQYFRQGIECLGRRMGMSYDDTRAELKLSYDGYHFSEDLCDIYNPFSIVNVFAAEDFHNYWFNSGTPSYVVKLLRNRQWDLRDLESYAIGSNRLESESIMSRDPLPTLYQSGYLTIKKYDPRRDQYLLGYPNREVEESFIDFLYPMYLGLDSSKTEFEIGKFVDDVEQGKPRQFMTRLDSLLRGVPHLGPGDPRESNFQNAIYLVFKMLGFYARMEDHTSNGRIYLTVETDAYVYVFEFKVGKTAAEAMAQIREKGYWKKFEASGKKIYLIGANFSPSERALDDIKIEAM